MKRSVLLASMLTMSCLVGCAAPRGGSIAEKQQHVREMRDQAVSDLYAANPALRSKIAESAGYGVFSNVDVHVVFVGGAQGYGVVVDQQSGNETFMRMAGVGLGFGAGLSDLRAVFVFSDREVMRKFVDKGWEFGGEAEAGAVSEDKGATAGSRASTGSGGSTAGATGQAGGSAVTGAGSGIEIYQLTEAGVVLKAALAGTKYYRDSKLND